MFDNSHLILYVIAYLVGGIPFGIIVAKLKGVNIRAHGSGNIGATNVGRTLGRPWGVAVFLLDAGKCFAVMTLAQRVVASGSLAAWAVPAGKYWSETPTLNGAWALAICGLCTIVGGIAPVYLRFRGGKAVSATVGTLMSVWPDLCMPALVCAVVWLAVLRLTRYVSVASIIGVLLHPILYVAFAAMLKRPVGLTFPLLIFSILLAGLVVLRHRSNIARIRSGSERQIGAGTAK